MRAPAALVLLIVGVAAASGAVQRAALGLLIDLHNPGVGNRFDTESPLFKPQCGPLNSHSVQHVVAAQWAAEVINNQSQPDGINIGIELFDTCGSKDIAMRDIFFVVKNAVESPGKIPMLGLIGLGEPEVVGETIITLHAFNIPLILASPRLAEIVTQERNILTTAPDMSSVVEPVVELSRKVATAPVSLISSCPHSIKKFVQTVGIMGRILQVSKSSKVIGEVVKKFLEESDINETIAMILEPEELNVVGQYLRSYKLKKVNIITGTIGLNKNLLKLWKNLFAGGFLVEPHMPELPDFRNYLLDILKITQTSPNETLLHEYIRITYNCSWNPQDNKQYEVKECRLIPESELAARLQIDPEVTFVVKAVSAFSAAMLLVKAEHCNESDLSECLLNPTLNIQQEILETLSQLSFTSHRKAPFELQGTSLRVTHEGQLVSNKFVVYQINKNGGVTAIGLYADDKGLVIDPPFSSMLIKSESRSRQGQQTEVTAVMESISETSMRNLLLPKLSSSSMKEAYARPEINIDDESGVNARRVTHESYITRPWATVVVAMAAVGTFITLFILVYVLIKICDGTLVGNQSLGIILILGIMTIYVSVVFFVLPGSEVKCSLRTFIYPLAMSVCYGILIIKVMQLRNLVLLGLGGRISYVNQYIILFFIVLVQIVINIQWYMTNKSQFQIDFEGTPYCYMPRTDFLLLHLYNIILVVIAFLYGLSVLKIRRNYKEGQWVTLAAFLTLPVFVIWGLVSSFVPERYDEPTVCVALIVIATIMVMAIFIPKMNTISKQSAHFKHKQMHMSDSVTTVFTTFTDLHNSTSSGTKKKAYRSPHRSHHMNPSMLDAYNENITKNPIYEVTNGAYP